MNTAEKIKRTRQIYAAAAQAINKASLPPTEKIFQVFEAGFNIGQQEPPNENVGNDLKFEGRQEAVIDQRGFLELAIKAERDPADDGSDETPEFAVICAARANGYETGKAEIDSEILQTITEGDYTPDSPDIEDARSADQLLRHAVTDAHNNGIRKGKKEAREEMQQAVYDFFTATAENQGDPIHNPPPSNEINQVLDAIWKLGADQGFEDGYERGKEAMLRKFKQIYEETK